MTYDELKAQGQFITWIYVKVGTYLTTVGEYWKIRHVDRPDEHYVWDYRNKCVTRIGEY